MTRKALGIDVASAEWASIGSAVVAFDDSLGTFISINPGAIRWPSIPLSPDSLADAIDAFVRDTGVCVVALDGPQGWRDPNTASGRPGVGRRCEYLCRTLGKTGIYPTTYPGNQRPWIEFSVQLFQRLLSKPGVELADSKDWVPTATYAVLECFPTSAWRTSGLSPLPGKSRRPALEPYIRDLQSAYRLPAFSTTSHDNLQAVIAAIAAVGAVEGPAIPLPEGDSSRLLSDGSGSYRLEGIIWNVAPLAHRDDVIIPSVAPAASPSMATHGDWIRVTQKVVDQVTRAGRSQMQIVISRELGASRKNKRRVSILLADGRFKLVAGDTHVIWRSHQTDETIASFERLFSTLSDRPGERVVAQICFLDTE